MYGSYYALSVSPFGGERHEGVFKRSGVPGAIYVLGMFDVNSFYLVDEICCGNFEI
jgi:hypothetical protein